MCGPASSRSLRRGERGGVSWVTLLLVVLAAGGAYLAWVWAPIYFDQYTVKQVVVDYMNQAIKQHDDAALVRNMVDRIRSLRTVEGVDAFGRVARLPAVPLEAGDVTWERDDQAKSLHVAFQYERQVAYPWIDRVDVVTFSVDRTGDLNIADWGPSR